MVDDDLQNDVSNIDSIIDDDDIMKDFNFDDILESPDSSSIDGIMEQTGTEPQLSGQADDVQREEPMAAQAAAESMISGEEVLESRVDTEPMTTTEEAYTPQTVSMPPAESEELYQSQNEMSWADSGQTQSSDNVWADEANIASPVDGIIESANLSFLQMYDGQAESKMYQLEKDFTETNFTGSPEMDTIHVNVGFDTYGWNVEFDNGVIMSLRDVKEYQRRQGSLPYDSGNISYGSNKLHFANIKRIVIYEGVKYFSYGA